MIDPCVGQGTALEIITKDAPATLYGVELDAERARIRHLLAVSEELHTNGTAGRTLLLRYRRDEAWATLVSFLGLPADPAWGDHVLGIVERKKRVEEIDGIGCEPVLVSATTEEVLEWIGEALRSGALAFPSETGAVAWPRRPIAELLKPASVSL